MSNLNPTIVNPDGSLRVVVTKELPGTHWQDILTAGGSFSSGAYNDVLASGKNPLENRNAWSGDSGGFITTTVDMPAAAGQTVQFRWILGHDQRIAGNGWFIDDVVVTDFTCDSSRNVVVHIANCRHLNSVEIFTQLDVSVGVPSPHAATANQCNLEGHTLISLWDFDQILGTRITAACRPVA